MILRLVLAELRNRPGRAAFLLVGYAFGVAVMVVLLAVGEAMLLQARDEALVGGGDLVILPAGLSPEMLKAGGTSSLFVGLDQARFIQRQILESPRGREDFGILAASPILDSRLVRISHGGRELQALAGAEIPSRAVAVGAAPRLLAGSWTDSEADRRWVAPTSEEMLHEIDRFHFPYGSAVGDSTWAEWHYFNVALDAERWLYLTYMVAGRVGTEGEWGGRLLLTIREPHTGYRTLARDVPAQSIRFDTTRADLVFDSDATVLQRDGAYRVLARVGGASVDLGIRPLPHRLFPPADLGGSDLVSGYVVPALAALAEGTVCLGSTLPCERVSGVRAYHDHNWGVWRDVSWEWGAASDSTTSLLYGVVRGGEGPSPGLFAYLVDTRGVVGLFRPGDLQVVATTAASAGGTEIQVPSRMRFEDTRRGLLVEIASESAQITDMERSTGRYFIQMKGLASVRQRGHPDRLLEGFFETYVD